MGLEPTTTGITIRACDPASMRAKAAFAGKIAENLITAASIFQEFPSHDFLAPGALRQSLNKLTQGANMRIRVVGGPSGGQWIEVADDLADFEVESPDGKRTRYVKRFWAIEYPATTTQPSDVAFFIPHHIGDVEATALVLEDHEARKQWVEAG